MRTQKELVQRSKDSIETDKDVLWSSWTWRTWTNFEHVKKKRSEDVVQSGRSKNVTGTQYQRYWRGNDVTKTQWELRWRSGSVALMEMIVLRSHCVVSAFLLRQCSSYCDLSTLVQWPRYANTTLLMTTLGFQYVLTVLIKFTTRLSQVTTTSKPRPEDRLYKYSFQV